VLYTEADGGNVFFNDGFNHNNMKTCSLFFVKDILRNLSAWHIYRRHRTTLLCHALTEKSLSRR